MQLVSRDAGVSSFPLMVAVRREQVHVIKIVKQEYYKGLLKLRRLVFRRRHAKSCMCMIEIDSMSLKAA